MSVRLQSCFKRSMIDEINLDPCFKDARSAPFGVDRFESTEGKDKIPSFEVASPHEPELGRTRSPPHALELLDDLRGGLGVGSMPLHQRITEGFCMAIVREVKVSVNQLGIVEKIDKLSSITLKEQAEDSHTSVFARKYPSRRPWKRPMFHLSQKFS